MSILSILGLAPTAKVVDDVPPPSLPRLVKQVSDGAWQDAEKLLLGASDDNRERLLHSFGLRDDGVELAQRWVQACGGSSIAHTLLGASMIRKAWKIRSGAYASKVKADAWQPFLELLDQAEEPLLKAARLDPATADPFGWLILAEVGKSGDRGLIDQYFAQAAARVPRHWPTYHKYFMVTTEKWGGSHDRMFRFAEKSAQEAPRGSMNHCLTALAYCEYGLALETIDAQIRNPSHAARVSAALYAWLDASPADLESRLAEVSSGAGILGINHFAVACYLCGANKEAKALIKALDGTITTVPWAWIITTMREKGNLGFVHDRVRREVARA